MSLWKGSKQEIFFKFEPLLKGYCENTVQFGEFQRENVKHKEQKIKWTIGNEKNQQSGIMEDNESNIKCDERQLNCHG